MRRPWAGLQLRRRPYEVAERRPEHPGALLAVLLTGQTMASMDGSIVTVALPSIQRELQTGGAALQLIVSGYLLTLGVLIVTGARIGDLLGHRRAFLAGLAGFTMASLLCGLAPSAAVLVMARVLQAVAAALMIPQVFSLIQLRLTGTALRRAIGIYSMVLALGVALGQLLGGLVVGADLFGLSWRPAFLINVPVGVTLLLIGRFALPSAPRTVRRLDLAGVALLTAAMAGLVAPLIFGREYGWRPWTWGSLAVGAVLLLCFGRLERRIESRGGQPLLDLSVLRPPGVTSGLVACLLVMGCYTGFLFAFTLYLQQRLGVGALGAGLAFVPYACGFAALSLGWPRLPERVQRSLPICGPLVFAAVAVTLATPAGMAALAAGGSPFGPVTPLLFAAGAGHAAAYSPLLARLSLIVGPERASALSALNSTGPMLASVIAIAGLGGLYLATGPAWTFAAVTALLLVGAALALVSRTAADRTPERRDPEGHRVKG